MSIKPICPPTVVYMECSTNTAIKPGEVLYRKADGRVNSTSTALTTAAALSPVAVAAGSPDADWPTTLASSRLLPCFPISPDVKYVADMVSSDVLGSATLLDGKFPVTNHQLVTSSSGEGQFVIESVLSSAGSSVAGKKVLGRFVAATYFKV